MHEHIQVVADKCRACRRCEIACIAAHNGMSFKEAMKFRDKLTSRVRVIKTDDFKVSTRCHQCDPAPCCAVCPTGALQQEADGRIIMRAEHCVACKMCLSACPYGAITMENLGEVESSDADAALPALQNGRQVAARCDMCRAWREENGKKITACMEACPVRALAMIDENGNLVEAPAPEKPEKKAAAEDKPAEEKPAGQKPAAAPADAAPADSAKGKKAKK